MRKRGMFPANRGPMNPVKPSGKGAPGQASDPGSDFASPNVPPTIVRYGPADYYTNYPESRVATPGRVPSTGGGLVRYTATVDTDPIRTPKISCVGKWEHSTPEQAGPEHVQKKHLSRSGRVTG